MLVLKLLFATSTVMETEEPVVKKGNNRKGGAKKKSTIVLDSSDSDNEINGVDDDDDDDFEDSSAGKKKGGRKPAAAKKPTAAPKKPTAAAAAKKPTAAAPKKRNGAAAESKKSTLSQKFITDMLQPAESAGISPEKKVRKMRESPFNKKSGSVLGRLAGKDLGSLSEDLSSGGSGASNSPPSADTEVVEVAPVAGRARPQRARPQVTYVLSESESDNDSDAKPSDFSDFEEDDD